MENKNKIYVGVLILSLFIGILLLSLYYAQDLTEDYNFISRIKLDEIEYTVKNNYLQYSNFQIGELTLETEGTFTKSYKFPTLIGCVKKSVNGQEEFIGQRIYFQFTQGNTADIQRIHYRSPQQEIRIRPDQKQTYKIIGSVNGKADEFLNDTILSLVLYKYDKKEDNPFDFNYQYDSMYSNDCLYGAMGDPYLEIPAI